MVSPLVKSTLRNGLCGVIEVPFWKLGVTSGIRADPHGFTGVYESVEKDIVAYGSGTWVRTRDTWVLWEGHGMVRTLLTGRTVRVCQYWTYGRGQFQDGWPTGKFSRVCTSEDKSV
jgi:hypothetical protein